MLLQLVRDRISRGLRVSVDDLPRIEQMNRCRASGVAQPRCLTTKQCQNQSGLAACNTLGKQQKLSAEAQRLGRIPERSLHDFCRIRQIPFFGRICGRGGLGTPAASPGGPCAGTRQASALKSVRAAPRTAAEKTRSCAIRNSGAASRGPDHSSRRCVKGSTPKGFVRGR